MSRADPHYRCSQPEGTRGATNTWTDNYKEVFKTVSLSYIDVESIVHAEANRSTDPRIA